jgi:serine/threonine protein kinase
MLLGMVGRTVSHYRVVAKLGAGGMGVVYKAEDTRLGRQVALKFLPEAFASDSLALQRFEREARTASALNHSNICALYDIGVWEGQPFLVMELLHGETLQERISRGPLPIDAIVELAIQIADALAAAHARGIVHRDIKPGNIFLTTRSDGSLEAKVLDFGLAKAAAATGEDEATRTLQDELVTSPGTAVGTIAYMSPEQARGQATDARSDLFSFGAVVYEMTTGARPFAGGSIATTLEAVLNRAPAPVSSRNPKTPAELERIIGKALEKDREVRYQTAVDLEADLKRLQRGLEPRVPVRPRRSWPVIVALAAVCVCAAGAWVFFHARESAPPPSTEWQAITNFNDSATQPALSPDGRMVAYVRGPDPFISAGQIEVKLLPDGEPAVLTQDTLSKLCPTFSPDGSRIAYTTVDNNFRWDTWVVPVLGGQPSRMLPNAAGLTWLDPQRILFCEIRPPGTRMALVTSASSRAEERGIYQPPHQRGMVHRSYLSPDRKSVLAVEMDNGGWLPCRVLPFDGSSAGTRVGPPYGACLNAAWSPDGDWIYLNIDVGTGYHVWRQRSKGGEPQQITFGPTEQTGIAISRDGRSVISSIGSMQSTVWLHDSAGDRQISTQGSASQPTLSSDGQRLYYVVSSDASAGLQNRGARGELWMTDLASSRSERLLPGFQIFDYRISHDDRRLVFTALDSQAKRHVWLAAMDRRTPPIQILTDADDEPYFGPGDDILFRGIEGSVSYLYRSKADGSGRRKVTREPILQLESASPDGEWALVWSAVSDGDSSIPTTRIAYPISGGSGARVCDVCVLRWPRDQKSVYLLWNHGSEMLEITTYFLPLPAGRMLPRIPPGGLQTKPDVAALPGARIVNANRIAPGPDASIYAYVKETAHRNLYRIPLP